MLNYKKRGYIITIDGPAGVGKSTVASIIAQKLGYRYINTGDLYRYITYNAVKKNIDVKNSVLIGNLSKKIVKKLIKCQSENNPEVCLDQKDRIFNEIHTPEIDKKVSFVAQHAAVRKSLLPVQRILAKKGSVVMEGRDIGSVILPDADLKFFLIANEQTRIMRRYKELKEKGYHITFQEVKSEIIRRDHIDSKRKTAPLIIPKDAITFDTSNKSIESTVEALLKIIQQGRNQ